MSKPKQYKRPFSAETLVNFTDKLYAEELARGTNTHRLAMLLAIKSFLLDLNKQEKEEFKRLKENHLKP